MTELRNPIGGQIVAFTAGAALALLVSGTYYHTLWQCAFDWGATGTWVSAAILFAALVLAWQQLGAFLRVERGKNTLALIDEFNTRITPYYIALHSSALGWQAAGVANLGIFHRGQTEQLNEQEIKIFDALPMLANYLLRLPILDKEKVIDTDLLIASLDNLLIAAYFLVKPYMARQSVVEQVGMEDLRSLINRCRQHWKTRPGSTRPEEIDALPI